MPAGRTEGRRPGRRLWAACLCLGAAGIALPAIAAWRDEHALLINSSQSLPNWAFFIHRNKVPERGDYVFFAPPASALVKRHFGPRAGPFGKIVLGLPGEQVEHRGQLVLVHGRAVARMKPSTISGEPLTPGAVGTIPASCYYVGTPHPDGFDSRYAEIGFVCRDRIIGTGAPIL